MVRAGGGFVKVRQVGKARAIPLFSGYAWLGLAKSAEILNRESGSRGTGDANPREYGRGSEAGRQRRPWWGSAVEVGVRCAVQRIARQPDWCPGEPTQLRNYSERGGCFRVSRAKFLNANER